MLELPLHVHQCASDESLFLSKSVYLAVQMTLTVHVRKHHQSMLNKLAGGQPVSALPVLDHDGCLVLLKYTAAEELPNDSVVVANGYDWRDD